MGLATSDPHSHKVQTKLYKILKFGVNIPGESKIQPFEIEKHSVRMAIHFFLNFDIFLLTFRSIYTKLGDFVKFSLHFMTMWITSC